ncbi:hypothetical protein ACOAKC_08065 [Hathewaya histolytica]|uniref:hypothetical protein n=1 Tax=Hathewaya histolytica TaxID=1498 RepID=UPI003B66E486
MRKRVFLNIFFILCCSIFFMSCTGKFQVIDPGDGGDAIYLNKQDGVSFEIPKVWDKNYKIITSRDKRYGKKLTFKKKDKKYNVILLEIWILNEEYWSEFKDVRKFKLIGKSGKGVVVYSRGKLDSILENNGLDIMHHKEDKKIDIEKMYIKDEEISDRIKIIRN